MRLSDKQVEVLRSTCDNGETIVRSANELGKTKIAALAAIWFFTTRTPARVVITSSTYDQLGTAIWPEIQASLEQSPFEFPFRVTHLKVQKYQSGTRGAVMPLDYIIGVSPNKAESFQGQHLVNDIPRTLVIFDEASGIDDEFKQASESFAHRTLVIGNPMRVDNFFYFKTKDGDMHDPAGELPLLRKTIRISGEDSPNVIIARRWREAHLPGKPPIIIPGLLSWQEYERRNVQWDEVTKTKRLHGEFYEGEEALLYPMTMLDASYEQWHRLDHDNRHPEAMGLDGAEGRDWTVWTLLDRHGIIKQIAEKTPNPMYVIGKTIRLMDDHGIPPTAVAVDAGHGGNAYCHRMQEQGYHVNAVSFGAAPSIARTKSKQKQARVRTDRQVYKNRRAEMYGILRELLQPDTDAGQVIFAIDPGLIELRKELAIMPLQYDSEGKMFLPPKDPNTAKNTGQISLRQLLGHSPDRADSLVLATFALMKSKVTISAPNLSKLEPSDTLKGKFTDGMEDRMGRFFEALSK